MSSWIELHAADGQIIPAWVAKPQGQPRGAVVVAQEIFGVNSHIRSVADRLAAQGWLAIAPALFTRLAFDVQLGYEAADMAQGREFKAAAEALPGDGVLADIRAAAAWAKAYAPGLQVGMVGFCWGGLLTWRAAQQLSELSAAVSYYGGGMTAAPESQRQPGCPVQAHFGRLDAWIPVAQVEALAQAQPGVDVHLYDADHGFNCDQRGSYEPASAALAWERTLAFFDQHLAA